MTILLDNTVKIVGDKIITETICDSGYRGTTEIIVTENTIRISISDTKK
jgi:hypothetical protein